MLNNYQQIPILQKSNCIPTSVHDSNNRAGQNLVSAYPNPFVSNTTIKFESLGGHTMIQIISDSGHVIRTLINEQMSAGLYQVNCDLEGMPEGIYYVRLQNESIQQVKSMMKVR